MFELVLAMLPENLPADFRFRADRGFHVAGKGTDEKGRVFFSLPLILHSEIRKGRLSRTEFYTMAAQLIYTQVHPNDSSVWATVSTDQELRVDMGMNNDLDVAIFRVLKGEKEVPHFKRDDDFRQVRFMTLLSKEEIDMLNSRGEVAELLKEVIGEVVNMVKDPSNSGGNTPPTMLN